MADAVRGLALGLGSICPLAFVHISQNPHSSEHLHDMVVVVGGGVVVSTHSTLVITDNGYSHTEYGLFGSDFGRPNVSPLVRDTTVTVLPSRFSIALFHT